jgi:UDP-glucose 6-dehydrogenase
MSDRTARVTSDPSNSPSAGRGNTKRATPIVAPTMIVGLGEVGRPLLEVLGEAFPVAGRDLEDVPARGVRVLHLCYPFGTEFVSSATRYAEMYHPEVIVVNSTVVPGTTRAIQERAGIDAVYSPVRGKHVRMKQELRHYRKFVAGTSETAVATVTEHFRAAGMAVDQMGSPEALELAKLLETSYFGLLIAWAQEMDRFARSEDAEYWELIRFFEEIDFLPPVGFAPGYIGGHCVMPNLELLKRVRASSFIETIEQSNDDRERELRELHKPVAQRLTPRPH